LRVNRKERFHLPQNWIDRSTMRYLLDTNTCIAAMRRHTMVLKRMAVVIPSDCMVSSITTYELFTGIEKCAAPAKEAAKVDLFLATVTELFFDRQAAKEAGRIRALLELQGCMIGPYDVLLAGHAQSAGLTLVTANTNEFSRVSSLNLEDWQATS
jgi:tRNA(fMet)-specific endonuclease VapC